MVQETLISHLTDNSLHFFEKVIQQFDDAYNVEPAILFVQ